MVKTSLMLLFLLWVPTTWAYFTVPGQGHLTLLDGTKQSLQFGFSFKQQNGAEVFQAGIQVVEVAELPSKYTLALVLHQDEQIWVTDWSNKPLQGFDWSVGKHSFKLSKNTDPKYQDKARGGYVLMFDNTPYFFHKNMAQIKFHFDKDGVSEVRIEGMFTPGR
ncbi:MAG: hypothetical protein KJ556_02975 [Gammaproteobacteria bacterium]|nr:hypothetical protein [Gammaproteobacteria bacterium]MBU2056731.1 hypothetical protein [Gammaproteobacteria bacterium]MBU2174068.1 hypothetical protein [Gammaproteobacteria bacterium]MBU2247374.1 hypothetical protein [Gammaproteobacteria bacterium]MBU2345237.1 hypothetical protein [Gammaproteobacteria bacterium]